MHWVCPALLYVRLDDDGGFIRDLEIHFEKIEALAGVEDGPGEVAFEVGE